MAIPIRRVMTFRSKLGSGKYAHNTLEELFALNKESYILKAYFTITNVDFTVEVLRALKLMDHQISKPGADWEKFEPTLAILYPGQHKRIYKSIKTNREKRVRTLSLTKSNSYLQHKNHGR